MRFLDAMSQKAAEVKRLQKSATSATSKRIDSYQEQMHVDATPDRASDEDVEEGIAEVGDVERPDLEATALETTVTDRSILLAESEDEVENRPLPPPKSGTRAPILERSSSGHASIGGRSSSKPAATSTGDYQRLLAAHHDLTQEKKHYEELARHYEQQYIQQAERNRELEQRWKKAALELNRSRQAGPIHKVDDDYLRALWTSLRYDCRNWATTYCLAGKNIKVTEEKAAQLFSALTPEFRRYIKSSRLRPHLIESFLIHELLFKVLTRTVGHGSLWSGKYGGVLKALHSTLEPARDIEVSEHLTEKHIKPSDVQEYTAWRAKTTMLLSEKISEDSIKARISEVAQALGDDLGSFVVNKKPTYHTELVSIVQKAVELDLEIQKSRAILAFQPLYNHSTREGYGFYFSSQLTESQVGFEEGVEDMVVELVVSPCFNKFGTADGAAYDKKTILSKCAVICTETRKKLEKAV